MKAFSGFKEFNGVWNRFRLGQKTTHEGNISSILIDAFRTPGYVAQGSKDS